MVQAQVLEQELEAELLLQLKTKKAVNGISKIIKTAQLQSVQLLQDSLKVLILLLQKVLMRIIMPLILMSLPKMLL